MRISSALYVQLLIQISSIAVLYYDYALTLFTEIQVIWTRKFIGVSILYVGCRLSILANTLYLIGLLNGLNFRLVVTICGVLGVVVRASILSTWTLRGWAIWNRNIWILVVFVPWSLCTVLLDILESTSVDTPKLENGLILSNLLIEFSIAATSIFHLVRQTKRDREVFSMSLSQRLINEGVLYIVVVTAVNLSAVIIGAAIPADTFYHHMLTAYVLPLSGLLTARIILDIKVFARESIEDSTYVQRSAIRFQGATGTQDSAEASTSGNRDVC